MGILFLFSPDDLIDNRLRNMSSGHIIALRAFNYARSGGLREPTSSAQLLRSILSRPSPGRVIKKGATRKYFVALCDRGFDD
jgi:hypothetical protein